MTALLEALRRIDTQRPSRAPVAEPTATPQPAARASAEPVAAPATVKLTRPVAPASRPGEPPLNSRAVVADDVATAAASLTTRFRAPAMMVLVTCGVADDDASLVEELGTALRAGGHPTTVFSADADLATCYSLAAAEELRTGRGYHLLHTTADAALEQTRLLASADGVVVLVELERTSIAEAESVVGTLRREAVAVSGILLIA